MQDERKLLCVGGPFDGQLWLRRLGAPARIPLQNAAEGWPQKETPTAAAPILPRIQYVERGMKHTRTGSTISVFAPTDWSMEQIADRLNEIDPDGELALSGQQ